MSIDWHELFVPKMSLAELVLRGSFMYLSLFAVLRVLVRRHIGSMSLTDLLLLVLIADAAQNAMAGKYETITEGVVLCATLVGWNYFFDALGYYFPAFGRLLEPPPLAVIEGGKLTRRHMRQELLTETELLSQLRQQGITDVADVRRAHIEPDGGISVVRAKQTTQGPSTSRRKRRGGL
jgi:uncharacterized membrane protein YcaP (DUF421 family)